MFDLYQKRTDLALEAHELYRQSERKTDVPGVEIDTDKMEKLNVTRVHIRDQRGEQALGKPVGSYITLEIPALIRKEQQTFEHTVAVLADELSRLVQLNEMDCVLVVGLGNWNITADALGPKVVSSLLVTRHLFEMMPEEIEDGVRPVCAFSPGVLGLTGIETLEIVRGVVERVKPQLVIAIDALASRRLERVSTTIQLSNTGITPGSGVGNQRLGLNEQTLGVPVVAIGVPTVVDAATMANDTIDLVLDHLSCQAEEGTSFFSMLQSVDREEKERLIHEVLCTSFGNLVVTPKEVDEVIEDIAEIISNSIDISLHSAIEMEDMNKYH